MSKKVRPISESLMPRPTSELVGADLVSTVSFVESRREKVLLA